MSRQFLLFLLYTYLHINIIIVDGNKLAFINMLKDFLSVQEISTKIAAYICWETGYSFALHKALDAEYIPNYTTDLNQSEPFPNQPLTQHLFLLDLDCEGSQNILQQANEKKLFQQPHNWLISTSSMKKTFLNSSLDILVDSKVYVVEEVSFAEFHLKSIYKLSKGSNEFLTNDIGIWKGTAEFVYFNRLSVVRNRTDLMGLSLNISYVITNLDSLNHLTDYRDKHIDGISKLNYIFTHHIMDAMNATKNFIMQSTWGYKNETTQLYSGLIGDLQSEVAELGGTPCFFTRDRIPIIDYIAPTTPTRAKFIFRSPPLSYITNVYYLPFNKMVWYANFLLIGIIAAIVYVIVKWEWKDPQFRNMVEKRQGALRPNFMDVIVLELGAICQQGSEAEPRSSAGRITTILVFMALMFMYTSYSANIVALLQSTTDSIRTLDDLLNSRIKLGVEDKPYSHYYFKAQTETTRKAIYTQKVAPKGQPPNFLDINVGIKKMREEFFAFHVECASGYKIVSDTFQENEKCGLQEIEYWQIIDPWIAVKKNSTYKELAKSAFRKLHESGIQNRELRRLYTTKPVCQSKGSNFMSVGLIDCYYAFLIMGVGTACSVLLLFMELIIQHKSKVPIKENISFSST